MAAITLHVPGMTCRHRIRIVTARLRDMPGVIMVAADAVAAQVVVHGEVSEVQVRAVLAAVMFPLDGGCDGGEAPGG
jgi:copper chaperone CopZ